MINDIYNCIQDKYKLVNKPELKKLVNFSKNLKYPIHRWFNIKEGYSKDLVQYIFDKYIESDNSLVIDPFLGSGTTLLSAQEMNINGIGFEINPFLAFLSKCKLQDYNKKTLIATFKELEKMLNQLEPAKKPKLSISDKLFQDQLINILKVKNFIDNIENETVNDFFKICFLSILEDISIAKKDGNGLRYPKNKKLKDFWSFFKLKFKLMLNDLKNRELKKENEYYIYNNDIRNLQNFSSIKKENDSIKNKNFKDLNRNLDNLKLAIFSPPYMNCFDYTEVYKIELWFGDFIKEYSELKELREQSLVSHLNTKLNKRNQLKNKYVDYFSNIVSQKKLWNKKIPFMIQGYFEDMWLVLKGLYKILNKNAKCIIVVGNSSYGNIAIPTDLILADIGVSIGFKFCSIEVARKLGTSSQQYKNVNNINTLRESLVILEK